MLRDTKRLSDASSRQHLLPVHLPVADRQREQLVSVGPDNRAGRIGIETAAEQKN